MVSVIIPVYNAEPYLRRCLDSVLNSTYRELELILVNDGSTDGSLEICREYTARDNRVTLISQENNGVSAARNRGLEVCRGEWVVFVDADDLISPDFLGLVAREEYQDQDLLLFDFGQTEEELTAPHPAPETQRFGPEDVPELLRSLLLQRQLIEGRNSNLLSPCGKAYRKAVIEQHSIQFDPQISYGEDQLFNVEYLTRTKHCTYLFMPVYYYNIYQGSSSLRFDPNRIFSLELMLTEIKSALDAGGFSLLLEEDFVSYVQSILSHFLWLVSFSPFNPNSFWEKCQLCQKVRNMDIFKQILMNRSQRNISQRWSTRILFFLFRTQQYGAISLITRLNYSLLMMKKPEEMRNSGWFQ